jgi:hypothetical protein
MTPPSERVSFARRQPFGENETRHSNRGFYVFGVPFFTSYGQLALRVPKRRLDRTDCRRLRRRRRLWGAIAKVNSRHPNQNARAVALVAVGSASTSNRRRLLPVLH